MVLTKTDFLVTIFVMSEGTAQGTPRPLQVFKERFSYSINMAKRRASPLGLNCLVASADALVAREVVKVISSGVTVILADGTRVTYPPHTIYKVTSKEVTED